MPLSRPYHFRFFKGCLPPILLWPILKVSNRNARTMTETCSKLTTRHRSDVSIVNLEQILHIILVFPLLNLNNYGETHISVFSSVSIADFEQVNASRVIFLSNYLWFSRFDNKCTLPNMAIFVMTCLEISMFKSIINKKPEYAKKWTPSSNKILSDTKCYLLAIKPILKCR